MPLQHFPGEGTEPCQGTTNAGQPCGRREIEGLEYCLLHVPDEYLDESEQITGMRRCRHRFGTPDACHITAVSDTSPPTCKTHGAVVGSVTSMHASKRVVEGRQADRLVQIMAEHGNALLNPPAIGNPLQAHLDLAAEAWALKEILRRLVAYLFSEERIRSAHARVGEQLRTEVALYERAIDRLDRMLTNIERAGVAEMLAAVEMAKVTLIERALTAALEACGLDIDGQDKARKVLRRELKAIPAA